MGVSFSAMHIIPKNIKELAIITGVLPKNRNNQKVGICALKGARRGVGQGKSWR